MNEGKFSSEGIVHEYLMPLRGKEISLRESATWIFLAKSALQIFSSPRNKRIIISLANA
jgi:hypothetical protein